MTKVFIVAPDPLFVDPITGKCSKLNIYDTENKWTQKFGIACFRNWIDAFNFTQSF